MIFNTKQKPGLIAERNYGVLYSVTSVPTEDSRARFFLSGILKCGFFSAELPLRFFRYY